MPLYCVTCMNEFSAEDQFLGENCSHQPAGPGKPTIAVCRPCAAEFLRVSIGSTKFPIKCYIPNCGGELTVDDASAPLPPANGILVTSLLFSSNSALLLTADEVARMERLLLQHTLATAGTNWFACQKAGCEGGIFTDSMVEFTRFVCEGCKTAWCVRCKAEFHDNETCERYQQWKKDNDKTDDGTKKTTPLSICSFLTQTVI